MGTESSRYALSYGRFAYAWVIYHKICLVFLNKLAFQINEKVTYSMKKAGLIECVDELVSFVKVFPIEQ